MVEKSPIKDFIIKMLPEIVAGIILLVAPVLLEYLVQNRIVTVLSTTIVICIGVIYLTFIKQKTKSARAFGIVFTILATAICVALIVYSPWCKSEKIQIRLKVLVDSTDEPLEVKEETMKITEAKPGTDLRILVFEYPETQRSNIRCEWQYRGDGIKLAETKEKYGCSALIKFGLDQNRDIINIKISRPDCTGDAFEPLLIQPETD